MAEFKLNEEELKAFLRDAFKPPWFDADEKREEAYRAGLDYAINGASAENCHFRHFATPEQMLAWQRGRDDIQSC